MKIEYLIQKIEDMFNASSTNFEYKIYDSLKMDNVELDVNKINGLARIVSGSVEPIQNLGQASVTLSVEFIYPYERIDAVNETCRNVAAASAGLVIDNSSLDADLTGTTGIAISYPIQGNYYNGTMGESAKSRIVGYFDINELAVLSNNVKLYISNTFGEININNYFTIGTYYWLHNGEYIEVQMPQDYDIGEAQNYYSITDWNYEIGIDGIYTKSGSTYTLVANWPQDYVPGTDYYTQDIVSGDWVKLPSSGVYYERSQYQVDGEYTYTKVNAPYEMSDGYRYYTPVYTQADILIKAGEFFYLDEDGYKLVYLPTEFKNDTRYYLPNNYERIPYLKQVITRHRLSTTNKYLNDDEMRTVNDGQSIDISLVVPSIKNSIINGIKKDMMLGIGTQKTYQLQMTDESSTVYNFYNMFASGDFTYETTPGDVALFKLLFVYKRT